MERREALLILLAWLNGVREYDYEVWMACKLLNYQEMQLAAD